MSSVRGLVEIRHVASGPASNAAYEEIYEGHGIRQLDSFYLFLLELLRPRAGTRLLDVSCGEGSLLRFAARRGVRVYGVDFSAAAVRQAQQAAPGAGVQVADAEALPYAAGSFHYVTCIGSIEHFEHPEVGASELARVLRPGGQALVLLPNTFGLWWNVQHVLRSGDVADDGQPIQRYGTRVQWARLLEEAGLQVERVVKHDRERPLTWRDLAWYLRRPQKLIMVALVFPLIPTNLASCLVYCCRKGNDQPQPSS